ADNRPPVHRRWSTKGPREKRTGHESGARPGAKAGRSGQRRRDSKTSHRAGWAASISCRSGPSLYPIFSQRTSSPFRDASQKRLLPTLRRSVFSQRFCEASRNERTGSLLRVLLQELQLAGQVLGQVGAFEEEQRETGGGDG